MTKDQHNGGQNNKLSAVLNKDQVSDSTVSFPDETAHLAQISEKLEDAWRRAEDRIERLDKAYMDVKQYMVQNRGDIDPHEMFQNELTLKRIDNTGAFAVNICEKIAKLKDSPYFARIDFGIADSRKISKYYIGRFGFSYKHELLIFDWRAPVASMFYDCEIGPAGYDAPSGRIAGDLTRKRQFKIQNGKLEYVLESSVNIQDDVLQRELSRTSDKKMQSIIATIQKEQNQIIRNEKAETMIIQGVAGSGKTSVALHRIAYLLYRFKDRLSAQNVTILSPNKVFGDYISNVLPELGEEPIYGLSLAEIAEVQLEGIVGFEAGKDPLETDDPQWEERVRFKSTLEFVKLMDKYLQQMPARVFVPADYTFGRFTAEAEWIQKRYDAYGNDPVKQRIKKIASDILERFTTDNIQQDDLPKVRVIIKSLNGMLRCKNTLALYKDFFRQMNIARMLVMPAVKTLEWCDVYPFLYLHAAFEGLQESRGIRHLVIDEMQDYTQIQYAVMNILFKCQKTIVGDFGQCINPNNLHTLEDIQQLYTDAELIKMNKSYRSTFEIINFVGRIQNIAALEVIERHGEEPELIQCCDEQDEIARIKEKIKVFLDSENVTMGIILKTNQSARAWYDALSKDYKIHLISPETTGFANGVSITSVQMSKGLEFDEVILPTANNNTYKTDYDRSLLYIACTRAMHRLTLTYTGKLTALITGEG
ncbi:MAG: hypothetical protein H6Q64_915 [Firmicutes bacterium]|nr:hypothetical protein [Bacillota bacterium]